MKDQLGGKIMTKFVGFRAKTYSYLIDAGSEDKKAKGTKKCVIKRKIKFENYKIIETTQIDNKINNLEKKKKITWKALKNIIKNSRHSNKLILKAWQRFKRERYNVFTEEIDKIALKLI